MTLKKILHFFAINSSAKQPPLINKTQNDNVISFYHISQNLSDLESFIKNGAQAIGKGVGGQTDGFYCWTKKEGFFSRLFALKKNEGLLITVKENKQNFTYPLWQLDTEGNMGGLFKNIQTYVPFLEKNANNLNIKTQNDLLSDMQTITSMQYSRDTLPHYYQDNIIFKGISKDGEKTQKTIPVYNSDPDKQYWCGGIYSAGFRQILVDYLCQNHPQFKEEYNRHMLNCLQDTNKNIAIKYTGTSPLKIDSARKVGLSETYQYIEEVLYTSPSKNTPLLQNKERGSR
ncbi:MAG: hypothetical protein IKV03_06645 [Alphaproteobacteria bacterium]|nr:hypothetical protein [Alphaproteobacteria bacterium]